MEIIPKKSLGQHWLYDEKALRAIADAADILPNDTVLEIGPGLGTLTALLVQRAKRVLAVEFDPILAASLAERVPVNNLTVVHHDILRFDLTSLTPGYVVVANIPYYLTSNLIRLLSESSNAPQRVVLLVQKEVAERVAAEPGDMSILSVTAQYYWDVSLGIEVPAQLFTPPPKVDSQVLILHRRTKPFFDDIDAKHLFSIVKAGFSQRRKTLVNSLSAGLRLPRADMLRSLAAAGIDPGARAQTLSLEQWRRLYLAIEPLKP